MSKGAERHHLSEGSESQRLTPEQLTNLWAKLKPLEEKQIDVNHTIELAVRQIERLQDEAATSDDSPEKYAYLRELIAQLNGELSSLPDSVEIE